MDSLLATYASSDEEEDQEQPLQQSLERNQARQSDVSSQPRSKFGGSFFSSLPPPKTQVSTPQTLATTNPSKANKVPQPQSKSGSSLPPPKSSATSLFSSLPRPKAERSDPFSLDPKPRKVVQFRPPVNPSLAKFDDDDDDDDDNKEEQRKKDNFITQTPSVKSFLSSIPAPRNSGSLGAVPSSAGTGRRSILEAEVSGSSNSSVVKDTVNKASDKQVKYDGSFVGPDNSSNANLSGENHMNYYNTYGGYANVGENGSADVVATSADYVSYDYSNYGGHAYDDTDHSSYGPPAPASDNHATYSSYEGYGDYRNYGQYESKWIDRSSGDVEPEIPRAAVESVVRVPSKRARNEIPQEVIEVNQDELMKNRPREDQIKLTGIAFGPSYQPASSGKGKPSKLHKRKHQIGSLYFDMRQKEMELAERRSKGFLTKAETQAKYGW